MRPIVFSTLVEDEMRLIVMKCNALFLDCFAGLVVPLFLRIGVNAVVAFLVLGERLEAVPGLRAIAGSMLIHAES